MSKFFCLTSFVLIFASTCLINDSFAAKKCKCDEDAVSNRETTNESWNKFIHEACASLINKDFAAAYNSLDQALKVGEDPYIKGMYDCLTELKNSGGFTESKTEKPAEAKTSTEEKPASTEKTETPVEKPAEKSEPEPEKAATPPPATENPATEDVITTKEPRVFTNEELAEFQTKGMLKVNLFQNYINRIGNKSISLSDGLEAIKNALKLFYGNTFVQVSSLNSENKPKFPTRTYLERVRALNYDRIEIEWAECQYTSNLKKAPDGNYYGYIKFRQRFKGIKDGRVVYEDITDKTIAVILKAYDKAIEGEKVENFDIFLGDIDVLQTMKN